MHFSRSLGLTGSGAREAYLLCVWEVVFVERKRSIRKRERRSNGRAHECRSRLGWGSDCQRQDTEEETRRKHRVRTADSGSPGAGDEGYILRVFMSFTRPANELLCLPDLNTDPAELTARVLGGPISDTNSRLDSNVQEQVNKLLDSHLECQRYLYRWQGTRTVIARLLLNLGACL